MPGYLASEIHEESSSVRYSSTSFRSYSLISYSFCHRACDKESKLVIIADDLPACLYDRSRIDTTKPGVGLFESDEFIGVGARCVCFTPTEYLQAYQLLFTGDSSDDTANSKRSFNDRNDIKEVQKEFVAYTAALVRHFAPFDPICPLIPML